MKPSFLSPAARRLVLAVWFAFLVGVIAFASGVAAWLWLAFGPGPG